MPELTNSSRFFMFLNLNLFNPSMMLDKSILPLYERSNIHHFDSNDEKAIFVVKKTSTYLSA